MHLFVELLAAYFLSIPAHNDRQPGIVSLGCTEPTSSVMLPGEFKRMPTTRLETTISALKQGAKSLTVDKAVSNIEGWEEYLAKNDHEGVKKVVTDLGKLKKLLHAKELDGDAIKTLLQKIGKETVAVAGDSKTATSGKIKELGETLSHAA